jgi:hypothetical protein
MKLMAELLRRERHAHEVMTLLARGETANAPAR